MKLTMITYGMLAGFGFLLALAVLEVSARRGGPRPRTATGLDADVTDQVWQVLAEARRITEEAV